MPPIDRPGFGRVIAVSTVPKDKRTHLLGINATTSVNLALGAGVNYVAIQAEVDCWVRFGTGAVVAVAPVGGTPGDIPVFIGFTELHKQMEYTHVAALAKSSSGNIYIIEMEEI